MVSINEDNVLTCPRCNGEHLRLIAPTEHFRSRANCIGRAEDRVSVRRLRREARADAHAARSQRAAQMACLS
jgi:hypothetical protein